MTHLDRATVEQAYNTRGAELAIQAAEANAWRVFADLAPDQRAISWRSLDARSKNLIISGLLAAKYGVWSESEVDRWVRNYNQLWG